MLSSLPKIHPSCQALRYKMNIGKSNLIAIYKIGLTCPSLLENTVLCSLEEIQQQIKNTLIEHAEDKKSGIYHLS